MVTSLRRILVIQLQSAGIRGMFKQEVRGGKMINVVEKSKRVCIRSWMVVIVCLRKIGRFDI